MSDNQFPADVAPEANSERPDFVYPEKDFRRPDFVGGIPVRMIDGQEWHFAEPRMRFTPTNSDYGFEVIISLDDDGSFNEMVERYYALSRLQGDEFREYGVERCGLEIRLGRAMLERNYRLPIKVLRSILQTGYAANDPAASAIGNAVSDILIGDVPKTSAGGDEPSPTPPACSPSETAC